MSVPIEARTSRPPGPRQVLPMAGFGPRGFPECYYTQRILDSTARYVTFINKLRAEEELIRIDKAFAKQKKNDWDTVQFFNKCHRKCEIGKSAERVQLCLQSYDNDLVEKRKRLTALLEADDERDLRIFVSAAQAGAEAGYQDKMKRLAYLLDKRHKEHVAKFSATPLEKCSHVRPCITKKEAEQIQRYQMREKKMRKMAEREMDQMWYEVAMKEAEALAARSELDEIKRTAREEQFKHETNLIVEDTRRRRQEERERLKQEQLLRRALMEEEAREEERQNKEKKLSMDLRPFLKEKKEKEEAEQAHNKYLVDLWNQLGDDMCNANKDKEALIKRKACDMAVCNKKLVDMKNSYQEWKHNTDPLILAEGQRLRDVDDLKRCIRRKEAKNERIKNQKIVLKQIEEKKIGDNMKEMEKAEYDMLVNKQIDELLKERKMTEAQARKLHQSDLRAQMEYSKLLKERAVQEELEQRKKYEKAKIHYQDEIREMLQRPFYSGGVNPFMQVMAKGVRPPAYCPCVKKNYCLKPPYAQN